MCVCKWDLRGTIKVMWNKYTICVCLQVGPERDHQIYVKQVYNLCIYKWDLRGTIKIMWNKYTICVCLQVGPERDHQSYVKQLYILYVFANGTWEGPSKLCETIIHFVCLFAGDKLAETEEGWGLKTNPVCCGSRRGGRNLPVVTKTCKTWPVPKEDCPGAGRNAHMSTPIGILWTLLSIMVAGTCSFSFLQPFWFIHPETLNSFGMYSYCVRDLRYKPVSQVCGIYGGNFHFSNLPSNAWQAACVLYGGGCAFLCLGAMCAIMTLCLPYLCDKRLAIFTGYIQTMAGKKKYFLLKNIILVSKMVWFINHH